MIPYPSAPRPSYADQVLSLFHDNGLTPEIVLEVRELQIAIGLVAAGEGIAVIPGSVRRARVPTTSATWNWLTPRRRRSS